MKIDIITRHDTVPYLWRLRIINLPWFGIYLHRFLAADDDCLHDHPFAFVSIILWGGYWEESFKGDPLKWAYWVINRRWYWPGSVLFRRAQWAHRIEVPHVGKTWSLVLRGPRVRPWGFFTKRFGWVHWRQYSHTEHCA
jgi:hypothetical protein